MSAYVHDNDHIDLIVTAIDTYRRDGLRVMVPDATARWGRRDALADLTPTQIGQLLIDENVTAVTTLYADSITADEKTEYDQQIETYTYRPVPVAPIKGVPFPLLVLAAIASYDYQACEDPNYTETVACKIITALRDYAIGELPGYNRAARIAWSYDREDDLTRFLPALT